jgi:hypothetical protein
VKLQINFEFSFCFVRIIYFAQEGEREAEEWNGSKPVTQHRPIDFGITSVHNKWRESDEVEWRAFCLSKINNILGEMAFRVKS